MQVYPRQSVSSRTSNITTSHNAASTTSSTTSVSNLVSIYDALPTTEVSLDEFVELGTRRLTLLRDLDNLTLKYDDTARVRTEAARLLHNAKFTPEEDLNSHFVLRLACCMDEEEANKLIRMEAQLFKYRLHNITDSTLLISLVNRLDIPLQLYTGAPIPYLSSNSNPNSISAMNRLFFLPFEHALDVVAKRTAVLVNGLAVIAESDIHVLILSRYRVTLKKHVASTRLTLRSQLKNSEKLTSALARVMEENVDTSAVLSSTKLTALQVPTAIETSAPLCMFSMYKGLQQEHHMRHTARMQFGLWLKGCGLPLDHAISFWRSAFSGKTPGDKFEKQYAYNIRHNYGQEGKRQDLAPYGCGKLITSPFNAGDNHGCPFRNFNADKLKAVVELRIEARNKVDTPAQRAEHVREIVELTSGRHYQLACAALFHATHPGSKLTNGVRHPNEYYNDSHQFLSQAAQGVVGSTNSTLTASSTSTTGLAMGTEVNVRQNSQASSGFGVYSRTQSPASLRSTSGGVGYGTPTAQRYGSSQFTLSQSMSSIGGGNNGSGGTGYSTQSLQVSVSTGLSSSSSLSNASRGNTPVRQTSGGQTRSLYGKSRGLTPKSSPAHPSSTSSVIVSNPPTMDDIMESEETTGAK